MNRHEIKARIETLQNELKALDVERQQIEKRFESIKARMSEINGGWQPWRGLLYSLERDLKRAEDEDHASFVRDNHPTVVMCRTRDESATKIFHIVKVTPKFVYVLCDRGSTERYSRETGRPSAGPYRILDVKAAERAWEEYEK